MKTPSISAAWAGSFRAPDVSQKAAPESPSAAKAAVGAESLAGLRESACGSGVSVALFDAVLQAHDIDPASGTITAEEARTLEAALRPAVAAMSAIDMLPHLLGAPGSRRDTGGAGDAAGTTLDADPPAMTPEQCNEVRLRVESAISAAPDAFREGLPPPALLCRV